MQDLTQLNKEIPYQWRVQSFSKNKPSCSCVAYIDARDVMKILDEVVGAENWQDDYKVIKDQMFAGIGIRVGESWVWKWDTGTESQTEAEKGIVSDSFKRAAVKWGVGRFLYDIEIKHIAANEAKTNSNFPYPVDDTGKRIYDLTKHINGLMPKKPLQQGKPPIAGELFAKALDRIKAGETDLVAKLKETYSLTTVQLAALPAVRNGQGEVIK